MKNRKSASERKLNIDPVSFEKLLLRFFSTGFASLMVVFSFSVATKAELEEPRNISYLKAKHPNHFSTAEVRWNEKTGNFEVALCVWPADLEKALSHAAGSPVDLDQTGGIDQMMEKYIADNFFIRRVTAGRPSAEAKQTKSDNSEESRNKQAASEQSEPTAPLTSGDADSNRKLTRPDTSPDHSHGAFKSRVKDDPPSKMSNEDPGKKLAVTCPPIRWVGFEANVKEAWLYFEVVGDMEPETWEIENRVFFEFNEEQVNQIRFTTGNQTRSYSLKHSQPKWQFTTARILPKKTLSSPRN